MTAESAGAILACGFRPEGSWLHLAVLVGFVLAVVWRAPVARPAIAARRRPRR